MSFQPFLIANMREGLINAVAPWLLPQDAVSEVKNAYLKDGAWHKRNGYQFYAQMTHATTVITNATATNPVVITSTAHGLNTGDVIVIYGVTGMDELNGNEYTITVIDPNNFSLDGIDGTAYTPYTAGGFVSIYATNPIMGIQTYKETGGDEITVVFDTVRAAIYSDVYNKLIPIGFTDVFTGDETQFFQTENYRTSNTNSDNLLYITNFKDPVYIFNGATLVDFSPTMQYGAGPADIVNRCKRIFAFKERLVALYTEENGVLRPQRARWSQAQNPQIWDELTPGAGGFVDAPTGDFIVSAQFLKDVLIVQFSNSIWTLRPTNDPALPFRWDKINSFRSVDAPFSTAAYDSFVSGFGIKGITACNGVSVNRIDGKIPNFVEEINQENFLKVYSQRYYQKEQTWTLYPSSNGENSDKVLVYNEVDNNWTIYDIPLTCLGYGRNTHDPAWEDYKLDDSDATATLPPLVWDAEDLPTEDDFGDKPWLSSNFQIGYPLLLGGTMLGEVYSLDNGDSDDGTTINMEITFGEWNPFKEQGIEAQMGYVDFLIDADPTTSMTIEFYNNANPNPYKTQKFDFLPNKSWLANITNVTQANPAVVTAPDHGLSTGTEIYIYRILGMDSLNGGQFTITVIDENNFSLNDTNTSTTDAYISDGVVVRGPYQQSMVWKRAFAGNGGFSHSIKVISNETNEPLKIHAVQPWFRPLGTREIEH